MPFATISDIEIVGISTVLPTKKVDATEYYSLYGKESVDRIIKLTGVQSFYKTSEQQTSSDLAYVAAVNLLNELQIDRSTIGALVFVNQTPDYRIPATAFILQHRLELGQDCVCFDINLGCTGYVNGLYTISSLMANSGVERALLLVAETPSKRISPLDRSISLLFGDCGTATILEKKAGAPRAFYGFQSLGDHFKSIIVPAGMGRHPNAPDERVAWSDGNIRSDHDTFMDGQDVFLFGLQDVPPFIDLFLAKIEASKMNYDYIILHQANAYLLRQMVKRMNFDPNKVPLPMVYYGNTSSTSIPLTLSYLHDLADRSEMKRLLLVGFGVGLSIGVAEVQLRFQHILPIVHSDAYYEEETVSFTVD